MNPSDNLSSVNVPFGLSGLLGFDTVRSLVLTQLASVSFFLALCQFIECVFGDIIGI